VGGERVRYHGIISDSARWDDFVHRPGDIVITTPPKCGTTWTQMICALLVFGTSELDRPLDVISPWLDMQTRSLESIISDLDGQRHRRFIKTHTPLDGLPLRDDVTYLCVGRDPRDVFLSWDNHMINTDPIALFTARFNAVGLDDIADKLAEGPPVRAESEIERFWEWADDATPITESHNLASALHHYETFWAARDRANVVLYRYEDLAADLEGQMRVIAAALGIEVDEEQWPGYVTAAGFESMRARADELTPESSSGIWHSNQQFFNKGTVGEWKRLLTAADLDRYWQRVDALASPDVVAWAHAGAPRQP
jgi:hypothetical protein